MKIINWGILGASKFAHEHMAPAIHQAGGARLYAMASLSGVKANAFAPYTPDLQSYASYEELLANMNIQAIYIPLPNHLHIEWSLHALEAGKHVLCEKPIALKASEIDALLTARDKSGLQAAEAYMIIHHPQWQRAKALYQKGTIGKLINVEGHFSYDNREERSNIRNRPETGGGVIPDIGVYTYGATRWVTGEEPQAITHAEIIFENNVDVTARVSADFESFSAHWVISMRMPPFQEMRFIGEEGVMMLDAPFNPQIYDVANLRLRSKTGTISEERFASARQYMAQVEAFGAAICGEKAFAWQLEDAQKTQAMIDAIYAKA